MDFRTFLNKNIVRLDGGMGTLLQQQGLTPGQRPEEWNLTHPDAITAMRDDAGESGAKCAFYPDHYRPGLWYLEVFAPTASKGTVIRRLRELGKLEHLPHKLQLSERNKLTMTGVTEVVSFEENAVVLPTVLGRLLVQGRDLKLKTLSLDGGQVAVDGEVSALIYEEPRLPGWRRLLG